MYGIRAIKEMLRKIQNETDKTQVGLVYCKKVIDHLFNTSFDSKKDTNKSV